MFEHCVRCTVCVENCPVFKVQPSFPGPKQSGPDAQRFRLAGEASVDDWVRLCCQCKRCEVSCPYGVDVADIILKAQLKYSAEHFSPFSAHLFANTHYLGVFASIFAPLTNKMMSMNLTKNILNILGLSSYLPLPEYRFLSLNRGRRKKGKGQKKVVFFHGCYLNYNRPDIGRGIRDLLAFFGCRVVMPHQMCCGLPSLGNGDLEMARRFARKNLDVLTEYINKGYSVIYSCTSCGQTLIHDYPEILNIPEGKRIAENAYNVHEYLLTLIEEGYAQVEFGEVKKKIAYHVPCHLRALGIGYPAARIFERIPSLRVHILDDNCCGLSGSYGFKKKNQVTAVKLGEIAGSAIRDLGADAFVSDCGACRMQLGHFSSATAYDPSQILIESLQNAPSGTQTNKRSLL